MVNETANEEAHMTNANPSDPDAYQGDSYDGDSYAETPLKRLKTRSVAPRGGLFGSVETRLLDLAEDGKSELLRSFDGLVMLAHELAAKVEAVGGSPVSRYVSEAAGVIEGWQGSLRDRPVAHLLDDGRELVRNSPRVAIGVAMVAGFVAARLIKSSSDDK